MGLLGVGLLGLVWFVWLVWFVCIFLLFIGSTTVKVLPCPSVLTALTVPSMASVISLTSERPTPVPTSPGCVLPCTKASKMRGRSSALMPRPVSNTCIFSFPLPLCSSVTFTLPYDGVYLMALVSRFDMIFSM